MGTKAIHDRGFFPPDKKWETNFTCQTAMKIQTRGKRVRTRLKVLITCGCGDRFVELADHDGSLTQTETDAHFRSMTLAAHRRYREQDHGKGKT